jgi:hypothetical protein
MSQPAYKENPAKALIAKLSVPTELGVGNKASAEAIGQGIAYKLKNFMAREMTNLDKADLKMFLSGQLDKEVWIETRALGEGQGMGQTNNAQAQRIAKALFKTNQLLLREMHSAGIPVRNLPEFVAPLTHDINAIRAAGVDAYVASVIDMNLDRKAFFGPEIAGDRAKEIEFLKDYYKGITLGKTGAKTALTVQSFDDLIYGNNLATKLTESRTIKFQDAKAEFDYNEKWGKANLSELTLANYDKKGRALGLISQFGSNPEKNLKVVMQNTERGLRREGNFEAADRLRANADSVMSVYHNVSGKSQIPGQGTAAEIARNVRALQVVSKLFNSGIRSIGNFAVTAATLKTYTGENFFETLGKSIFDFTKTLPPGEKSAQARDLGYFFMDSAQEISRTFGDGDLSTGGVLSKSAKLMMKLNAMDIMNNGQKIAAARGLYSSVAKNLEGEMSSRMKATFLGANISEADQALLKTAIKDMPDGRRMLLPEDIRNIDPELVKQRVAEYNDSLPKGFKKAGRLTPEAYLTDLENKYFGLAVQTGNISSTTPGGRERAALLGQTYAGTLKGEALRFMGQFKTFWVQSYLTSLQVLNANPDEAKLARGIVMSGKKDYMTMAQWAVTGTALGYIGQAMIDVANGKNPKSPKDIATWFDALAKGGVGGIYADFVGQSDPYFGFSESILGPVPGQVFGAGAKIVGNLREGKGTQAERLGVRLLKSNTPFQQMPGVKQALDYAIFDNIQEALTPGYKAKQSVKNLVEDRKNRLNIGFKGTR